MYHPGKVLKVFSPSNKDVISSDLSTQALVEMWDENVFTVLVHDTLANSIKEGDIVLVDYPSPTPQNMRPKNVITKILKKDSAKDLWNRYKNYHKKRKNKKQATESRTIYAG